MNAVWDKIKPCIYGAYAGIVAILAGVAYYFFAKEQQEEKTNASLRTEAQLAKVLSAKEEAQKDADDAEKDFDDTVAAYNKQSGSSSDSTH